MRSPWYAAVALFAAFSGCNREGAKRCHDAMETSQPLVTKVAPHSLDSVERALDSVEAALDTCRAAERDTEVSRLTDARDKLAKHLTLLRERERDEGARELSPAELERLVQRGDPGCPKGQGYKHRGSGRDIRCTGPQPIAMNHATAMKYFERRGYKTSEPRPGRIVAEYGAEKMVFDYAEKGSAKPPDCATLYPPPGMSWQEAVARLTGARVDTLEKDEPVPTPRGQLPLAVDEGEEKLIIELGDCAATR